MRHVVKHLIVSVLLPITLAIGACAAPEPDGKDPSDAPDGGTAGPDGGPGPIAHPPTLQSVLARATGRTGADLRIDVSGADEDGDAAGIELTVLNSAGAEVPTFDNDFDGEPESGTGYLPFDGPLAPGTAVEGVVTLLDALANSGVAASAIASVRVVLKDGQAGASEAIEADVAAQPVRNEGESCDPTFVFDRCADGLGCKGMPSMCAPGEAPEVTQVAYLLPSDALVEGPRLLVRGTEPDDDLAYLHVETLDADGVPVTLDNDGDGIGDTSTFSIDATSIGGAFFVAMPMGLGLQDIVGRVAVTPEDAAGRSGARVEATLAAAPVRNAGASCSPEGFDVCAAGSVCSPGMPGVNNTCQSESAGRTQQCNAAPHIEIVDGAGSYLGVSDGASLWDAPPGCSPNDPRGRPEQVVMLSLQQDAARVTITTDTPNTAFDTTVYVLSPCNQPGSAALTCGDDGEQTLASTVTLQSVPAGDYAIVVDSFAAGGAFGLQVTVE